jgi:membrane protein
VVRVRGTLGVVGIVGLLWSASAGFGAITRAINQTLGAKRSNPFFLSKVRYFLMTVAVSIFLVLSVGVTASLEVLANLDLGALLGAAVFELGKRGFLFYLGRVANFEAVYGSLSSIIVLLMWLYVSALVLLLGAEYNIVRWQAHSPGTEQDGGDSP